MIKKDLFSLDVDTLSIIYSRTLREGTVQYCYICENAHIGCSFHCKRYGKKIETKKEIRDININFIEICQAQLAEQKGE